MWYNNFGNEGDVVLSSRIRLARNLKDTPFPIIANSEQQEEIIGKCKDALIRESDGSERSREVEKLQLKFIDLSQMKDYEKQAIAECHLISPDMIDNKRRRGLVLSGDSRVSIMINEEDHLRIQCMEAGFDIDKCLSMANTIDDYIEEKLDYAFDNDFGYLTCCPTNVGTGLRASVMVHLPGYVLTNKFSELAGSLSKLGLTVRGIYGEGSKGLGNIFQISNQMTLGMSEEDIASRLKQIIKEVIANERELRSLLYKNDKYRVEDRVMRSLGTLKYAVAVSTDEAMKRLSDIRLGVALGIIKDVKYETLNEITYSILPANIIKNYNTVNELSRDLKRGDIIRERMC
ncbi:MAG TPA: protein arginine kinase [Candidatus Monoglobus merdigallinarum]|uniref:Protein-arginine kinase n=1 Tax=Candidatus Monoglobus merdigallinarum TaxID=2838698 RepID=A0A9D1PS47_9FIRM|nr:protein arginine kinase [Candidatus Monoglobus merdigallinarum]